jgi:hypothetical protein
MFEHLFDSERLARLHRLRLVVHGKLLMAPTRVPGEPRLSGGVP